LEHAPEAVEVWVAQLCQRFAQGPIAVALEQSRGALVFMLSKYERLHLFPGAFDDGRQYARGAISIRSQG